MLFRVKSSRDTSVGFFRAGSVYNVPDSAVKTKIAIAKHLEDGGPFEKLTKAEAKRHAALAVERIGPADVKAAQIKAAEQAEKHATAKFEAEQTVADAKAALEALKEDDAGFEAAKAALEAAETALAEFAE